MLIKNLINYLESHRRNGNTYQLQKLSKTLNCEVISCQFHVKDKTFGDKGRTLGSLQGTCKDRGNLLKYELEPFKPIFIDNSIIWLLYHDVEDYISKMKTDLERQHTSEKKSLQSLINQHIMENNTLRCLLESVRKENYKLSKSLHKAKKLHQAGK